MKLEPRYKCDKCGKIAEPRLAFGVPVGWSPDPGGGHGDHYDVEFDLCADCAARWLRRLLRPQHLAKGAYPANQAMLLAELPDHPAVKAKLWEKT